MSTIFAVIHPETNITARYDEGDLLLTINGEEVFYDDDLHNQFMIEVGYRTNYGRTSFTNDLAQMLPEDTPVWGINNGPQGIFTIGDIKREI